MVQKAAWMYDQHLPCGAETNSATRSYWRAGRIQVSAAIKMINAKRMEYAVGNRS